MESSPKDPPSATAFFNFLETTNSAINIYFLKSCSHSYFSISKKIPPILISYIETLAHTSPSPALKLSSHTSFPLPH